MPTNFSQSDVAELVVQAQMGDAQAWERLVDGLENLVWSVVRGFRLPQADAEDAAQMTWLRAVERLDSIREPERFGLWLATTARRECMRCRERGSRFVPTDLKSDILDSASRDFAGGVIDVQESERALNHLTKMQEECRQLLRLVLCDPPFSYNEVAEILGVAVGTIGPRRQRCLSKLRASMNE